MADGLKKLVKRLTPPIFIDAVRGPRWPQYVWEGVYQQPSDVPVHNADYGGELIDEMVSTTANALAQWQRGEKPVLWHEAFALVAASIATGAGRIRVVDFGGGAGSGFVQLLSSLPPSITIDYLVVDSEEMAAAGRRVFAGDPRIRFAVDLPAAGSADLVYVNSVLQYIEDYEGALERLAAVAAPWLFFARLAAGHQPRFVSGQRNLPGRVLPYWFLNVDEIGAVLSRAGYELSCDSFADRVYDQGNLPETHRVERFRDMLFTRRGQR